MTDDPRRALARVHYLLPSYGMRVGDKEFDAAWEWLLNPKNAAYVADSRIGKIVEKVDTFLRWAYAAGCEVTVKDCPACRNTGWVCEAHPDLPWQDEQGESHCGYPGAPCSECGRSGVRGGPRSPSA